MEDLDKLRLVIDSESVNIYFDHGEDKEPVHVVCWHQDEFFDQPSAIFSMARAIDLFYTSPITLLTELGYGHLIDTTYHDCPNCSCVTELQSTIRGCPNCHTILQL